MKLPFFREFSDLVMLSRKKVSVQKFTKFKQVWVPNRNGLFISIAACFAEYHGAELIVTGFNREEAQEFPDNKPQFIAAINHSLMYSTLNNVKVVSFVSEYTKPQIYKIGMQYKAPLAHVYSCYLGNERMCGKCASCKKLRAAKAHAQ